jgi:serine/threonine protein kinase
MLRLSNSFSSDLLLQDVIADQSSSVVYEAKDSQTGATYALKIAKPNSPQVGQELSLLSSLSHPSIVPVSAVRTPYGEAFVMPYAFGGDLLSWIESRPLDEETVKGIIFNVLRALAYLHGRQIWHRDIKPENILVMDHTLSPDCCVLADFGFSREFPEGVCTTEFPGSLHYAAPELLRGESYTEKVDIWALGITMFACLTSRFPFKTDPDEIRREILAGLPGLFEGEGIDFSVDCHALLDWMLAPNPAQRPSAEEALNHPWFGDLATAMESAAVDLKGASADCRLNSGPVEFGRWEVLAS